MGQVYYVLNDPLVSLIVLLLFYPPFDIGLFKPPATVYFEACQLSFDCQAIGGLFR
jgi:hypothetical protein